ncbi:HpcH/HpaI aldolase/citrate lyase family protein [Phyllobacterium leguminum]|uniref:Citrate lyase subunit beta/citryl-CoA lyase n=1 Tax=Phyllobacterium leguminum TaxID=314237 RepID=A0A318T5Z2_9HYPH|nr:aldolase/citrate lyase family protein [Phyllobacterium leguminum]PYE89704.1 citrate lyase subunit beta/citryl-CoA lyase [Phyllobacterium leguminum]
MRSLLLVPDDSDRKLEDALSSGADALVLDLHSVTPSPGEAARARIASFLRSASKDGPRLYVKISGLDSALADDDLAAIMPARPHGVVLPRCDSAANVVKLSARLNVHEAEAGLPEGVTEIIAITTGTAIGTLSMASYRGCTPRLVGLGWDAEGLAAIIGARTMHDENGCYTDPFRLARTLTLFGAKAADVAAIDTACILQDEAELRKDCAIARRDGFTAKLAIHPAQVPIINAA